MNGRIVSVNGFVNNRALGPVHCPVPVGGGPLRS
jgi:hypothetical protein